MGYFLFDSNSLTESIRERIAALLVTSLTHAAILHFRFVYIHAKSKIAGALPAGSRISVIMFPGRDDSTHNHFIDPL